MAGTKDSPPVGALDQFQLALYASKGAEPPLNGTDMAVLMELIDRFKKKEGVTYPSSAGHLARETGRPSRSVQESLRRLQDINLAMVVEHGTGTKGNTYTFNFAWVREVAAEIHAEKEARAAARKRRRKSSYAENRVGSTDELATRKSAPLRDIVTRKFAQLGTVATRKSAPQTYVDPTESLRRCDAAPAFGLASTQGGTPLEREIEVVGATTEQRGSDTYLVLTVRDGTDNPTAFDICLEASVESKQRDGQARLQKLQAAIGMEVDETGATCRRAVRPNQRR